MMKRILALCIAVVTACVAHAQTSITVDEGVNYTVLTQPEVIKELKITDAQKKTLEVAIAANEKAVQAEMDLILNGDSELEMAAIQKTINEITEKHGKALQKKLAEILNPEQTSRFYEIELQLAGVSALDRKDISKALNLTATQSAKVKKLVEEIGEVTQDMLQNGKMEELPGGGGMRVTLDPNDEKKLAEMGRKALEEIKKTFSDEQKEKWAKLTGPEFKPVK